MKNYLDELDNFAKIITRKNEYNINGDYLDKYIDNNTLINI